MEITAPLAERLSLNASDCCFIKRKRNRFSNAERNRRTNAPPANRAELPRDAVWCRCTSLSRESSHPRRAVTQSSRYFGKLVPLTELTNWGAGGRRGEGER